MMTRICQTVNSRFSRSYFNLNFNEHIDQINRSERLSESLINRESAVYCSPMQPDAFAGIATLRMGIKSNLK